MRDLTIWTEPLQKAEQPGLDSVDSRLTVIMDLVAHRQFQDAADRSESLFAEGIYDIRPISCHLFAAFFEGGFSVLPDVLTSVASLIGDNLPAIGPVKKREEHFDRRLAWLFETIIESIEYHQKKTTPDWSRWNEGVTAETIDAAIDAGDEVREKLAAGPYSTAGRTLGRLLSFLRGHAEALRTPVQAPIEEPTKASEPVVDPDALQVLRKKVELVVSQHFLELSNKLRAFEMLIEKGEQEKAALVADDVLATLDAFDPRLYFPEHFSRFSALVSTNIGSLSAHWGRRDSVEWKALTQYYRVDLKSFVEG